MDDWVWMLIIGVFLFALGSISSAIKDVTRAIGGVAGQLDAIKKAIEETPRVSGLVELSEAIESLTEAAYCLSNSTQELSGPPAGPQVGRS